MDLLKSWLSSLFLLLVVAAGIFAVFLQNWWMLGLCVVLVLAYVLWPGKKAAKDDLR